MDSSLLELHNETEALYRQLFRCGDSFREHLIQLRDYVRSTPSSDPRIKMIMWTCICQASFLVDALYDIAGCVCKIDNMLVDSLRAGLHSA